MSRHSTTRHRPIAARILIPVATLIAAAALTAGTGANFVSSSTNTANSFATGTLTQSNSKPNAAIFSLNNLKPGDSLVGTVTIANTGTLASTFTLTEDATNGFVNKDNLELRITTAADLSSTVWEGTFGELTTAGPLALGDFAAGESREYIFTVTLDPSADNTEQGKSASASYAWDAIQTDATTYNQ